MISKQDDERQVTVPPFHNVDQKNLHQDIHMCNRLITIDIHHYSNTSHFCNNLTLFHNRHLPIRVNINIQMWYSMFRYMFLKTEFIDSLTNNMTKKIRDHHSNMSEADMVDYQFGMWYH